MLRSTHLTHIHQFDHRNNAQCPVCTKHISQRVNVSSLRTTTACCCHCASRSRIAQELEADEAGPDCTDDDIDKPPLDSIHKKTKMGVCVTCGAAVASLYKSYGPGNVSLSKCGACGAVADPYVEQDWVLQALDLALLKRAVLVHMLLNDAFGAVRTLRVCAFVLLVDSFVRIHRAGEVAAARVLEMVWGSVVSRLALIVVATYAACFAAGRRPAYALALFAALLVGSVVPLSLEALSLVWDYQQLWGASVFVRLFMVASHAAALDAVLRKSDPLFCIVVALCIAAI